MFGCGRTGLNMHFGGLTGKSFEKSIDNEYWPPYHGESFGPGITQFHLRRFVDPSWFSMGLATKPKGWSLLQSFLYFLSLLMTSSLTYFFIFGKIYNWLWKYLILRVNLLTVYFQKYFDKILEFINFANKRFFERLK